MVIHEWMLGSRADCDVLRGVFSDVVVGYVVMRFMLVYFFIFLFVQV